MDFQTIPNGIAGGIAVGKGSADADAAGFAWKGSVGGNVSAVAGGLAETGAYTFHPSGHALSIGVGSFSQTFADGDADGRACQLTTNGSLLGASSPPLHFWDSEGFTAGIAGQASKARFDLDVDVYGDAKAGAGAEIKMWGNSYTESYRYIDFAGNKKSEGMGSNVGAFTTIESFGYRYEDDGCWRYADADLHGRYNVVGGAATMTVQKINNGTAKATAVGFYTGSGHLGSSYTGSAKGYSYTRATTIRGMSGSVMSAGAGMQVTSIGNHNCD